jgi:hypothetical protein
MTVVAAILTTASVRSLRLCEPGCATPTQDFRGATAFVIAHASRGDQILFDPPYLRAAYDYYAAPERRHATRRAMPKDEGDSVGESARAWLLSDFGDLNRLQSRSHVRKLQGGYAPRTTRRFPSLLGVTLYARRRSS